jgi:IMP dehydrogenase
MKFKLKEISSIEEIDYTGKVHDLTVEDDHSYVAENIVVHNSICSTRLNTGFGVPLLTAVQDCAEVKETALLIADGGIKSNGDIIKAIAFGADLVMLGKMFAATSLAPGSCFGEDREFLCKYDDVSAFMFKDSTKYKEYRGMASVAARKGVLKESSVEGVSGLIHYGGDTDELVVGIENNMRSALGYAGASNWKKFRKMVKAVRISNSAIIESQTHVK